MVDDGPRFDERVVRESRIEPTPLVSAVIPAYNAQSFIARAVSSVLGQTYRPVECIVVDDGSTDGTAEVVRSLGGGVRLVSQANKGVSSARNKGAEVATGSVLAFLDADDVWVPEKLEKQMAVLNDDPTLGLVYSGALEVDERLNPIGRMEPARPSSALRNTLLLEQPSVTGLGSTGLVPVERFRALDGFDERLSTSADCDFTCRIASRYAVACIAEPLTLYRRHPSQMSADLKLFEHDMRLVFEKLFADDHVPPGVRSLRRRANANLYFILAAGSRHRSGSAPVLRYLLRACANDPVRTAQLLWRTTGRRLGARRSTAALRR